jgi:hypothetical protein
VSSEGSNVEAARRSLNLQIRESLDIRGHMKTASTHPPSLCLSAYILCLGIWLMTALNRVALSALAAAGCDRFARGFLFITIPSTL